MKRRSFRAICAAFLLAAIYGAFGAERILAQSGDGNTTADMAADTAASSAEHGKVGPSTGLPIPRFVSMKASSANVRRGPSLSHRIDWVFRHQGMPLVVTGEYGHWRRVMDRNGLGGWVHYALLSGRRTVLVEADELQMRARPASDAPVRARAERGVVAQLDECARDWCRISAGGYRGWVPTDAIWGVTLDSGASPQG
jgi:SH3-like domain-containing protein